MTQISKPYILYKGAKLGHVLLLDTRKPYTGSPMTQSHLTLSGIDIWKSRSLRIWNISRKGAKLGHILLFSISRKAYVGSQFVRLQLTLVTLKGQYQGHSHFEELHHMLLLNTNSKSYMGSPIALSHLTSSGLESPKLKVLKWSKIDTCMVGYCLEWSPDFTFF